jgi:glutamine synthetase
MAERGGMSGRARPGGRVTIEEIMQRTAGVGTRLVRFLYCDNGGIIRAKAVHPRLLPQTTPAGLGLMQAAQLQTLLDRVAPSERIGPVGEVRLTPDLATFVLLPYGTRLAALLCDLTTLDGAPWALCPRSFLKRQVDRLARRGLRAEAAFEPEFTLCRWSENRWVPFDESLRYSTYGMMMAGGFIDDLVAALEAQGLQPEQYYPEQGHGQQEVTIAHAPAVRAADNQILYRETVRALAGQHGLAASMAPRPFPSDSGNGAHLHLSLWEEATGRNLLYDPATGGFSAAGRHFVAGLLARLPALLALTCPSVNSYRRLQPATWTGAFACYGPDNREAAIRLPSPRRGAEEATTRLELRPVDNAANPYLALGAVLAAGLDGLDRRLDAGPPLLLDPLRLGEEARLQLGVRRLPQSLPVALDALQTDPLLTGALGPELAAAYLAVKRQEAADFAAADVDYEFRQHFLKY